MSDKQGSDKKTSGGDPASSVMMTAPLDKTKEVAGDYKRFHDATDSGPSMNTATGLMHEAAEAVSKGMNVLRGTLGREGEKAAGSGVLSGIKETGKTWMGGDPRPADRGVEAATAETTKGTLDVGLERAKSEGAAYYAKLKETLPSPSTQDVKQGTQDVLKSGQDAVQSGLDKARAEGLAAMERVKAEAHGAMRTGQDAVDASMDKAEDLKNAVVPPSPLSSLLSHLPHLNKPEVVKSMGHAPENYGADKVVSAHHETPDYVKTMGHAPENYQGKVVAPEGPTSAHLPSLPSLFKKTG